MAFRVLSARPLSTVIALATVGVAGCVGPLVDEIQLDEMSARTLKTDIAVYESLQLRERQYNVLGPVQANSCYNIFFD